MACLQTMNKRIKKAEQAHHCTLYNVHCTLYNVHCKLYTLQCTLYSGLRLCIMYHFLVVYIADEAYDFTTITSSQYAKICLLPKNLTKLLCLGRIREYGKEGRNN